MKHTIQTLTNKNLAELVRIFNNINGVSKVINFKTEIVAKISILEAQRRDN